jgi:hypothetical protein
VAQKVERRSRAQQKEIEEITSTEEQSDLKRTFYSQQPFALVFDFSALLGGQP